MPISPTAEGFRTTFRLPALTLAEIAWRWTVGATAIALFLFGVFEYVDTLPVTSGDRLFLETRQPYLVAQAIAHIFHGSAGRAMLAVIVGSLLLLVLWVAVASLGRIASLRALLDYFRFSVRKIDQAASPELAATASILPPSRIGGVVGLNFLRAAAWFAALVAILGSVLLSSFVSTDANPEPGLAFLLFLLLIGMVWLAWIVVNWILSLACVFAVRDGSSAIEAIAAGVGFCRVRASEVVAVSAWTGLAHIVIFVAATIAAFIPLGFIGLLPWRLILLLVSLVTLAYLAAADWLYTARLAGYVCIVEMPEKADVPQRPSAPPEIPLAASIDRDELILSDMPAT